jgi:hypothetical protein
MLVSTHTTLTTNQETDLHSKSQKKKKKKSLYLVDEQGSIQEMGRGPLDHILSGGSEGSAPLTGKANTTFVTYNRELDVIANRATAGDFLCFLHNGGVHRTAETTIRCHQQNQMLLIGWNILIQTLNKKINDQISVIDKVIEVWLLQVDWPHTHESRR